ncbi:MAG TPA: zinc ribbon domain-containing protein [Amycolatopsis sp.]|jgi:hypothetical protein|nr:zinc ribbon domain-containing protein [Amycolatopsis sp.]
MKILVDYVCGACGRTDEHWMPRPVDDSVDCRACGGAARRRFGVGMLVGSATPARPAGTAEPAGAASCAGHAGVPGSCVLVPTAARALAARARGDNRALDAELAGQQRAIAAGTLDPGAPVTTPSPAHAAAGAAAGTEKD